MKSEAFDTRNLSRPALHADGAVAVFEDGKGWRTVTEQLPFATRHVQLLAHCIRLVLYSANEERRGRIVSCTLEPAHAMQAPEASFQR